MDDATGRLMHLRFCDSENAFDYMMATRQYIDKHGKPVAFYSDKHAVFRVSGPESRRTGTTQSHLSVTLVISKTLSILASDLALP